jgi:hypothetical protein
MHSHDTECRDSESDRAGYEDRSLCCSIMVGAELLARLGKRASGFDGRWPALADAFYSHR